MTTTTIGGLSETDHPPDASVPRPHVSRIPPSSRTTGAVTAAVVDVVDHARRLHTLRNMYQQAAPSRPVRVGEFLRAHHQRRPNLVAGNLLNAVDESGQLDATDGTGAAVVVLYADEQLPPSTASDARSVARSVLCLRLPAGNSCLRSSQCLSSSSPPAATSRTSDQVLNVRRPLSGPRYALLPRCSTSARW